MRRQRNMTQMKEQIKTPGKEKNNMEISNLSDAEFKTLVIRMLKELRKDLENKYAKVPNEMDTKRPTARHIIVKMPKVKSKERILNSAREKELVTFRRVPIRLLADFSKETLQATRDWQDIFKVKKSQDLHTIKITLFSKAIIRIEG